MQICASNAFSRNLAKDDMDIRKLKTILELFENSSLTEIEFCEGEERIRLSKQAAQTAGAAAGTAAAAPPPAVSNAPAAAAEPATVTEETVPGTLVESPIVGTFYRAPSPEKPPFVSVGDKINAGDTLCIVEAMKLLNEIPSPVSGTVRQILAENGEPVGYGAKLFVIE